MAKSGRRSNLEGCIRQRSDGRWEGQIKCVNPQTKEVQRKSVYGKTKGEVSEKVYNERVNIKSGRPIKGSIEDFKTYAEYWFKNKPRRDETTQMTYHNLIKKHVYPAIGTVKLKDLNSKNIQDIIDQLRPNYAATTCRSIHNIIKQILRNAIKQKLIAENPADDISLPTVRTPELKFLNSSEATLFLKMEMPPFMRTAVKFGIYCGLRRGELLGLQWGDVNLEEGQLYVRQSFSKVGAKGKMKQTKTETSTGTVDLTDEFVAFLRQLKEQTGGTGQIISNANGEPMNPDYFRKAFKKVAIAAGFPTLRFHDLRHTHATLLAEAGVDQSTIMARLRHKDIRMAARYIHRTDKRQRLALDKIKNALPSIGILK